MKVSVIFSFRNEESNIPTLIERCQAVLSGYDYELIFVDDVSNDNSLALLQEANKTNPSIKILHTSRKFGVTPCVFAGFEHASGDVVIYMDSDLQDPPEVIPQLLEQHKQGYEVVHTVRTIRKGENFLKMWLTKGAYKVINTLSPIKLPINAGDFKLLSRKAVNEVLKLAEFDPYLRGMSVWVGFKQTTVKYERDARHSGDSKFSLFGSLNPYKEFLRGLTSFSLVPLYIALYVGFSVSLVSFVLLVYVVITKVLALNLPGWSAIMTAILFTSGMILFTIGVLGIYVGRIYEQVRGRPKYIVSEKIGFDSDD